MDTIKGRSSKFREGSRVRQTPEEGRRTYRPKRCGNNHKDEDNSPKTLNDKNQKFRQRDGFNFFLRCWGPFQAHQSQFIIMSRGLPLRGEK